MSCLCSSAGSSSIPPQSSHPLHCIVTYWGSLPSRSGQPLYSTRSHWGKLSVSLILEVQCNTPVFTELYSKAIEQVCGVSPSPCVLVECKDQRSEKWDNLQNRVAQIQFVLAVPTTRVHFHRWNEWCSLYVHCTAISLFRDRALYEYHQPPPVSLLSWSRWGLVNGATQGTGLNLTLLYLYWG